MNIKFSSIFSIGIVVALGIALWRYPTTFQQVVRENEAVLRVGTSADYKPFSFIDNGKIVGFDIDIIKEIGKRLKKKVILTDMPFDMLVAQLQTGGIDVIAAGLSPSEEKAKAVFFTSPHYFGPPLVMVSLKTNASIAGSGDLIGKRVVVNQGYTADTWISGISGPIVHRLATVADAFIALENNKDDVFITAEACIKPYFEQFGSSKFSIIPIEDTVENVSFAISKANPKLYAQMCAALKSIIGDGALGKITKKWNP